jgi:protein TonB
MELKKNPNADIDSNKLIFLMIGLIIVLSGTIIAMEWKFDNDSKEKKSQELYLDSLDIEEIFITRPKPPPPKDIPPPPPEVPEEIEIKENEEELINEAKIEDAGTDQNEMIEIEEEEFAEPFISVEQMPMLGDCKDEECTQREIMKFISRNFKYPEIAKANGVEGRVILEFVVEKDGKVGRVKILKGLDKHVDKAAIEVVEKLPVFSPGKQIGKAVPVKYTVPIKCTLG